MKFFRIIFQSFFLTVHIVIVILFLLAALSDRISPETFTLRFPGILYLEFMPDRLLAFYAGMAFYLDWSAFFPVVLGAGKTLFPLSFAG